MIVEWYTDRKNSILTRLDPRMKQYLLLIYVVSTWLLSGWPGRILPLVLVLVGICLAKIPFARLGRAMLGPMVICLLFAAVHLNFVRPVTALGVFLKLMATVLAAYLISATTGCMASLDGLLEGFHLRKSTAWHLVLFWHFIPLFRRNLARMREIEAYRNRSGKKGNPITLLIPALLAAREDTGILRISMLERGYDAERRRVPAHALQYTSLDFLVLSGMAVYVVGIIFI